MWTVLPLSPLWLLPCHCPRFPTPHPNVCPGLTDPRFAVFKFGGSLELSSVVSRDHSRHVICQHKQDKMATTERWLGLLLLVCIFHCSCSDGVDEELFGDTTKCEDVCANTYPSHTYEKVRKLLPARRSFLYNWDLAFTEL